MNDTTNEMMLRAELKTARAEAENTRRAYLSLCDTARMQAQLIVGQAGTGHAPEAYNLACDLLQSLATAKHQFTMRQEQLAPGRFDLAALRVDAALPSDSETGYEDRG